MKPHCPLSGYAAEAISPRDRCRAPRLSRGAWLCFALLAACSAPPRSGAPPTPLAVTPLAPAPPAPPEVMADTLTPALDAVLIQHVPEGTFGPYLGTFSDGRALALWAAQTPTSGRRWFSMALDPKGAPLAPARDLAEAMGDLALATVVGTPHGFVALATGVTASGTRLTSLELGRAGELMSGPTPVVHDRTEVLWLEALHVGSTAVALWATLAVGTADIHLAALKGAAAPAPVRVLERARAWQAVEFSDGIALAAVIDGATEASRVLRVSFLDAEGHVLGQTDVAKGKGLAAQIDAARIGDNLVVCWVERDGLDDRLYTAALAADTRIAVAPRAATAPFGSQRLLEIVPPGDRRGDGWLIWENVGQAPGGQQRVQLARLSDQARVEAGGAELTFVGGAGDRPEFARKGNGLAALTRAVACAGGERPCASPEPIPIFVELGPELDLLASEPVRLASAGGRVVELAWGLHCSGDTCAALGALPAAPVPLFGIELRARSNAWPAMARRIDETPPRARELRTVAETDPLADVATVRSGAGTLVASLTQFDESTPYVSRKTPAPDGRLAPLRALLTVSPVRPDGKSGGPAQVVSYRARATSGIALSAVSDGGALLAWSALDKQRPEVFATLLSRTGAPVTQRLLTAGAGDVSQVAAATLKQGYAVAWVGSRDGDPQVFGARLDPDLARAAPEQQLSRPPLSATAVSLLPRGNGAWLASVQSGEHEQVLAITPLDPKTLAPRAREVQVRRTETGALLSPVLVAKGAGALVAWIERPLIGGDDVASAWWLELDPEAQPKGEPRAIASAAGDPIAVRLSCDGDRCRGVLDCRPPSGHVFEAFSWDAPANTPSAELLVRRASASADTSAFALTEGSVFYADRQGQRGLLRRVGVDWQ